MRPWSPPEAPEARSGQQVERVPGATGLSVVLLVTWVVAAALTGDDADAEPYLAAFGGLACLHLAAPAIILALRARLPEPPHDDA